MNWMLWWKKSPWGMTPYVMPASFPPISWSSLAHAAMLESIACCHPIRPKLSVKVYNVFCKEHEEGQFTIKVSYEEAIQPNCLVELVGDFWKTHSPLGGAGTIKHSRRCVFGCAMPFFNWWKSVVELFQYSCASQGLLTDSEQCCLEPLPELVFDS